MKNRGPDPVPHTEVIIEWPFEAPSGKHLLYLMNVKVNVFYLMFSRLRLLTLMFVVSGSSAIDRF